MELTETKRVPAGAIATIRAVAYMTRPWNWLRVQVPATLVGILGGFYTLGVQTSNIPKALVANLNAIICSAITVAAVCGAGYIINDYFDQDIDAINEPNRPIPSGIVSSHLALATTIVLFAIGLGASLLIGYVNLIIAAVWVVFAVWYAVSLKRTGYGLESLTFGIMMGMTAMFGSATVLHDLSNVPVWLIAIFMALYITALHMTGTLKDIDGDKHGKCKTAAIVLGENRTRILIPVVYLFAFLVLLYVTWRYLALGPILSAFMSAVIAIIMVSNISALQNAKHTSIVRAHGLSKTFLYAIFVILTVHFIVGVRNGL